MNAGKDYMADKPGITTLEQLADVRQVQAETKRIYSIMYSERFENRATVRAGELVKAGAIGDVVQTIGLGPHRMNPKTRPEADGLHHLADRARLDQLARLDRRAILVALAVED